MPFQMFVFVFYQYNEGLKQLRPLLHTGEAASS